MSAGALSASVDSADCSNAMLCFEASLSAPSSVHGVSWSLVMSP